MFRTVGWWGLAAWVGCGQEAVEPGEPEGAPDAAVRVEAPSDADPAAMIAKGPPPEGPIGRALVKVAEHYGAAILRCPLGTTGRVRQIFGTARDQLVTVGPLWHTEIDPATDAPWDFVFDEAYPEDGWSTILLQPNTTRAWVGTRSRMLEMQFDAAAKGQVTTCRSVAEVPMREVKGKVPLPVPKNANVVPCLESGVLVAEDGTFVAKVPTPCTLWVDAAAMRSEKVRVEPGTEPLEVSLTLQPDPDRDADGAWTEVAVRRLDGLLNDVDADYVATQAYLEALRTELGEDKDGLAAVHRWQYEHTIWGRQIQRARQQLDVKLGRKPSKVDRVVSPPRAD